MKIIDDNGSDIDVDDSIHERDGDVKICVGHGPIGGACYLKPEKLKQLRDHLNKLLGDA